MGLKWILLVALFSLTFARPEERDPYKDPYDKSHEDPYGSDGDDSYEFWYHVDEKDHYGKKVYFGHHENKTDDKVVGHYFVLLPDTRKQKVTYYVDGYSGFVADVSYEGEPVYEPGHGYGKGHSKEKKSKEYD